MFPRGSLIEIVIRITSVLNAVFNCINRIMLY